jgi:hypothetical protein
LHSPSLIEFFVLPIFGAGNGGLEGNAGFGHLIDFKHVGSGVDARFLGLGGALIAGFGGGIR